MNARGLHAGVNRLPAAKWSCNASNYARSVDTQCPQALASCCEIIGEGRRTILNFITTDVVTSSKARIFAPFVSAVMAWYDRTKLSELSDKLTDSINQLEVYFSEKHVINPAYLLSFGNYI